MPYPNRIDPDALGTQVLALIETHGWDDWSLREVTAALGVSPNALYRYVEGRDGLVLEVAIAATCALHEALLSAPGTGEERLIEVAHRYVRFAVERPQAFSAFAYAKPPPDHPAIAAWLTLWSELANDVAQILPHSASAAAFAYWALLHGRAELARGPARLAEPTAGLHQAVQALLRGYDALGPVDNPLPPHVPVPTIADGPD